MSHRNKPYTLGEYRLYVAWSNMKIRCEDKGNPAYGGQGISVCSEWALYANFNEWSMRNGYARNLVIDRVDNKGNYEPDNCRWITREENARLSTLYRKSIDGYSLTRESASLIKQAVLNGEAYHSIAGMFGVCVNTVCNVACGRSWVEAEPVGRVTVKSQRFAELPHETKVKISILIDVGDSTPKICDALGVRRRAVDVVRSMGPLEFEVACEP